MRKIDVASFQLSPATLKAYDLAWWEWEEWCEDNDVEPLGASPEEVANYLIDLMEKPRVRSTRGEQLSMGSLNVQTASLSRHYKDAGLPNPVHSHEVEGVMRGLGRMYGRPLRKVRALTDTDILRILDAIDTEGVEDPTKWVLSVRNASLFALGFAGALRRSEIVSLRYEDVEWMSEEPLQAMLHIRRSKTDQAGLGQRIPVVDGSRIQPLTRLQLWLEVSGISEGWLFQTMRRGGRVIGNQLHSSDVPRLVKLWGAKIGLDPTEIAGHSLRAGFITSAAKSGASLHKIMDVSRHKGTDMVLGYIRDQEKFENHAGGDFL